MANQVAWTTGIAVVIPCFRVVNHVESVIAAIGSEVDAIYCVDDACPERSGDVIEQRVSDPRVRVIRHASNQGVGGAVKSGYRCAIARSEEHTSELQSLMRISYAVFCLKK